MFYHLPIQLSLVLAIFVGGRGLIYLCKVDHSRIFIHFSRNWLGLNNLCEILQVQINSDHYLNCRQGDNNNDNNFLFWHLHQIHTFNNNFKDEETITSHLMFDITSLLLKCYNFLSCKYHVIKRKNDNRESLLKV